MTSKLKSSLMLFIFKCFLLDRRHLVWHSSQGRPWCCALYGSITRRQPFCADTKAVGLTRDSLWNLSQSCTTMKKTQMHSAPCLHTSRSVAMLPSRLSICHYTRLFAPSSSRKTKSINHFLPHLTVKKCLICVWSVASAKAPFSVSDFEITWICGVNNMSFRAKSFYNHVSSS